MPVRFILVETSRAGNIGAAARAMKTMGFSELVLVNPREADAALQPEAIAFASGALDVLQAARTVTTMDAALEGCNFAAAVSARLREFSPPVMTPRAVASLLADRQVADHGFRPALVFGNERVGLPNQIVERCNALINIPANPVYSSLNLAQAVQIVAYECALGLQAVPAMDDVTDAHGNVDLDGGASSRDSTGLTVGNPAGSIVGSNVGNIIGNMIGNTAGNAAGNNANARASIHPKSPLDLANPTGLANLADLADLTQVEAMYRHLEEALVGIGFLDPSNPRKLMSRLRRLFSRTSLETDEVNILRGIARHIQTPRRP